MVVIEAVLGLICAMAILPLVTGYCAYSHGRSFWLWFALGCVLPIGSFFVLFALLYREQLLNPGQYLVDEAREILAEAELADTGRR
ncbi:hypothetical protein LJY25_07860 [Hymenobacter sp. BT175]|uniref:hypothetical protein n=1 Tax=Hymenobacter translucens TaxID=2886507 RepID=UPI001D0F013E|nr:hypothetical protein [Hymenobacter translucens]MCC2546356.1 hypothetical protein [Hymenobacter translucens]